MADKEKELPSKYLDRRVVERYMKKGIVDEKEFHKNLKTLPDLTDKATTVETGLGGDLGPQR